MAKIPALYLQHRYTVGHFNQSHTKKQPSQKQQEKRIKHLASQPGLHSHNVQKQTTARAMIQLVALFSSVRNTQRSDPIFENGNSTEGISQCTRRSMVMLNSIQNSSSYPEVMSFTPNLTPITRYFVNELAGVLDPVATIWHQADRFLEGYDPLTFPGAAAAEMLSYAATVSPELVPPQRHVHSVHAETRQANAHLIHYLRQHGNRNSDLSQKEILIAVIAARLFGADPEDITQYTQEVAIFARHILAETGRYGGHEGETLSLRQAESTLIHWMFNNILGMSPEEYIARKIIDDKHPTYFSVDSLHYLLSLGTLHKENLFNFDKIPKELRAGFYTMWFAFLTREMPLLKLKETEMEKFLLGEDDFSALYAGSRFLTDTGVKHYSGKEAIQVGEKMWDIALDEDITEDHIRYFRAPALFFMAQQMPYRIKQENNTRVLSLIAVNEYLQHQRTIRAVRQDLLQKYARYLSAAQAWMSKEKLAEKIIAEKPIENISVWAPKVNKQVGNEKNNTAIRAEVKQRYLNGQISLESKTLNELYQERTANVANSFYEVDKYLIDLALKRLPQNESNFIFSEDATLHPVSFHMRAKRPVQYVLVHGDFVQVRLERTDLFSANVGREERIYALKEDQDHQEESYQLIRVDRDLRSYIEADLLDYKKFGSDYVIKEDMIEADGHSFIFSIFAESRTSIGKEGKESELIEFLSKKHREQLYASLYASGDHTSDNEKVWNIVKHIIPFYDCVEGIINDDPVQAVPSCLLDAVSFIPTVGQATRLSHKFGSTLAKGIGKGGIALSKGSLSLAVKTTLREVSLPTVSELVLLGKSTLRGIDPGLELLTGVSKKFGEKVMLRLLSDKKTADLVSTMKSLHFIDKLPSGSSSLPKTARLPDSEIPVPVQKVGHDGKKDLYVQVDPETGEAFGYRYTIDERNTLIHQKKGDDIPIIKNTEMGVPVESDLSTPISKELEKLITPEMYEKSSALDSLSSPDSHGLRWNKQQDAFLKVKNNYIKIKALNDNRFLLGPTFYHHRTVLRFRNDRFFVENIRERLHNILNVGLSGRKRKRSPIDVLKEVDGFTPQSAEELLSQYQFPKQGLFNENIFALEIEQTGCIPDWADRFKKIKLSEQKKSEVSDTVKRVNPNFPAHTLSVNLGDEIGMGNFGEVFLDADNTNFVIKVFKHKHAGVAKKAYKECQNFIRYYGPDSAKTFYDNNGNHYIRMYRIPGAPVASFPQNSLPADAIERLVDMLEKMNAVGILHGDLHPENVFWDPESQLFYPLDISDIKEHYFKSSPDEKAELNDLDAEAWDYLLEDIQLKIKNPAAEKLGSALK